MSLLPLFRAPVCKLLLARAGGTRLLRGLCMLLACVVSVGLGFHAGSSHDAAVRHFSSSESRGALPVVHNKTQGLAESEGPASFNSDRDVMLTPVANASAGAAAASSASAGRSGTTNSGHVSVSGGAASFTNPAAAVSSSSFSAVSMPEEPDAPKIQVPLIYQNINPAVVGLSSTQVAAIDKMRSDFNAQVGQQQNPADPQYAQSWESAQVTMDDKLRAFLGWDQFNLYQINAARKK